MALARTNTGFRFFSAQPDEKKTEEAVEDNEVIEEENVYVESHGEYMTGWDAPDRWT